MRLSRGHRHWVYWSGVALVATGALWLVYRFFLREHGEFGEPPHPMEEWWLRLHGTFAVLMLIIAGSLLPIHVRVGWHQRKNLLAGSVVVAIMVLLIASGYTLYYQVATSGDGEWRRGQWRRGQALPFASFVPAINRLMPVINCPTSQVIALLAGGAKGKA